MSDTNLQLPQEKERLLEDLHQLEASAATREQELSSRAQGQADERASFKEQVKTLGSDLADAQGQLEMQVMMLALLHGMYGIASTPPLNSNSAINRMCSNILVCCFKP